jgi:hypothetical protein
MQYLLLCCFDEKRWQAIAKCIPTISFGGTVEVRPLEA